MAAIFAYRCHCCDKIFEGSPSFGFKRPDTWLQQSPATQAAGSASDDFCTYEDEDGHHYFIRTCLEIPIIGVEEPFLWGVWVSLSKKNYERYRDTYGDTDVNDAYFGYLCNSLPGYPETHSLHTQVRPQAGKQRPQIEIHESDHPLSVDFREGITIEQAQRLAQQVKAH